MGRSRNSNGKAWMRDKNSQTNLDMIEARIDAADIKNKYRFAKAKYKIHFHATVQFQCQLFLGDKPFPRFNDFTVFERAEENKKLEDKFASTFINGETSRKLSTWKWVDYPEMNKARDRFVKDKVIALRVRKENNLVNQIKDQ